MRWCNEWRPSGEPHADTLGRMMRPIRKFVLLATAGALSWVAALVPAALGQSRGDASPGYGGGMPAFCQIDHRARGAEVGAAIGEARGGPRGAQLGAAIGAARGERIDALCRHIAALRAERPAAEPPPPGAALRQPRAASGTAPAPVAVPARQSPGDYRMRYDQLSQAVAPPTEAPAASEHCMLSLGVSFPPQDAPAEPVTGQVCEGSDGKLREKM
jgi:hypothetical protein